VSPGSRRKNRVRLPPREFRLTYRSMVGSHTRGCPTTVVRYGKTRIAVTKGPDAGFTLDVAGTPVRIGTALDNDIVLTDDTVSRRHCEIEPTGQGVCVRDTGSTNGVLTAGMHIREAILVGSVSLQLGQTTLLITPLDETVDKEQSTVDRFGDLLGRSARMRELFADLERIARTDVTLLVEGETGTGKDLVAESVHRTSARSDRPYVVFDCGAVAPTLIESELFGHERGAFTGAVTARPGVFEQADGGTLFLDELGELPKDLQPKLLRVLEKRDVRRVGATKTISVDVRVIAATNRNTLAEVRSGSFRQDLYFRIATAHVTVPPLRDRMDDLPMLVAHFMSQERPPRSPSDVSPDVWDMFRAYRWPGNVRELRNAVQRLLVTPGRALGALSVEAAHGHMLEPRSGEIVPLRIARRDSSDSFERAYLEAVLAKTEGNVTRAAAIAEVSRQMVQKLMRKHGLGEGR
jgi:transcriptional regulator with PAS, ATPase and Fis domain